MSCGFITHVKGEFKIKAHTSLDAAVKHAKNQTNQTGVIKVCPGSRHTKIMAKCKDYSCSEGLSGLSKKKRRKKAKR